MAIFCIFSGFYDLRHVEKERERERDNIKWNKEIFNVLKSKSQNELLFKKLKNVLIFKWVIKVNLISPKMMRCENYKRHKNRFTYQISDWNVGKIAR